MTCRPPMQRVDFVRNQQTGKEMVVSSVDLSDTVQGKGTVFLNIGKMVIILALGPRYQPEDFDLQSIFPLEPFSSGVQRKYIFRERSSLYSFNFKVLSINDQSKRLDRIKDGQPLRVSLSIQRKHSTFFSLILVLSYSRTNGSINQYTRCKWCDCRKEHLQ